ncbi:MAG: Mur ligase family protein [Actinomycetota bacterium]|jgi:dihydrofolate synthase/folylpolyglutamate synthase|nr:Mur ligase family protein [Actinomycetota bacterium]
MRESLSYDDAVAVLKGALTFGVNPSLDGIRALTECMGRPQDAFASVQVTGTNGKSSVTRMTAAILGAHGMRASAYTSPEMQSYTERFEVEGAPVSEADFSRAIAVARDAAASAAADGYAEPVTEFELLTAAALWLFREQQVDIACLEVGMGGRWDATSVVDPSVAVITGVGIDHTAHLGTTRDEIAADKARIIQPASTAVLGPATAGVDSHFLTRVEECDTHAWAVRPHGMGTSVPEELTVRYGIEKRPSSPGDQLIVSVRGVHADYGEITLMAPGFQAPNVATAIAAVEAAMGRALNPELIRTALSALAFPGRFEVLHRDPWIVVDGAHNPQATRALGKAIEAAWPDENSRPVLLLGVFADKDARGMIEALAPLGCEFVLVSAPTQRGLAASDFADVAEQVTGTRPAHFDDIAAGLSHAIHAGRAAGIVATGSITVAGAVRDLIGRLEQ